MHRSSESGPVVLQIFTDKRGELIVCDFDELLPFAVKRTFFVGNVPQGTLRGAHAHLVCHQFLLCTSGSLDVRLFNGDKWLEISLEKSGYGIYVPPMTWAEEFNFSNDALLTVFASHRYDPADYIHDFDAFVNMKNSERSNQ